MLLPIPAARAAEWSFTPSIGITESYTDNAGLAPDNADRQSDLITNIAPGIAIRGNGPRVNLNLDYAFNQLIYLNDTGSNTNRNSLAAAGNTEIFENFAFLDAQASITRQVVDPRGPASQSEAGQQVNRTTVRAYNISPSLRHRFGSWLDTTLRASYAATQATTARVADTTTLQETLTADSGRNFTRFRWGLVLNRSETRRDDAPTLRVSTANSRYNILLSQSVSLISTVGYEKIEDDTLDRPPTGVIWSAGMALRPGPRSSLEATYGRRFDSDTYSFDANYQISPRTALSATYSETIRTSQQVIAEDLSFIGIDEQGNLIDTRTGEPFTPGDQGFGLQTNTFRAKSFVAGIRGTRRRNTFSLTGSWRSRKTDRANATGEVGVEQIVVGGALRLGRTLSKRTRGAVSLNYRNVDFGTADGRVDDNLSVSGILSYTIFRNARANLSYAYTQRKSNDDANEFHENSVVLRLSKTF